MAKYVLATPYVRGNSDVITNYEPSAEVPVGSAVILNADGQSAPFAGVGVLKGVAAYQEADKRKAVIESGKSVPVLVDAGVSPSAGNKVYVTAAGLFTNADKQADETANTLTKAVFVSGPEEVVNGIT
jgi:hypothetical protein